MARIFFAKHVYLSLMKSLSIYSSIRYNSHEIAYRIQVTVANAMMGSSLTCKLDNEKPLGFPKSGLPPTRPGDPDTLSIVRHVGLHVDFSSKKFSLSL